MDENASDEVLDDIALPAVVTLLLLCDGFLRGLLVAGLCPASDSFLIRFMIVGKNLLDKDKIPGSCKKTLKSKDSKDRKIIYLHTLREVGIEKR